MKVFIISQGQDTGGQGQRTASAFRKYTDWDVQFMCVAETYIKYPIDVPWDLEKAQELYDSADVVEHQNYLYGYAMYERGECKPTLIRHHGSPMREHSRERNREAQSIEATQLVSTVDLLDDCPEGTWTPCFMDLDWIAKTYVHKEHPGKIRIGHGPTVRKAKGTNEILKSLDIICKRNSNVTVDLIEGVQWSESLRRKSNCDIWIDQLTLGYGVSSIEAMAMGIPVISAFQDQEDCTRFIQAIGGNEVGLPFLQPLLPDPDPNGGLPYVIQSLIDNKWVRQEVGEKGRQFAQRFHSEERGVAQLKLIYAETPESKGIKFLWLADGQKASKVVNRWRKNGNLRQDMVDRTRQHVQE